MRRFRFGLEPVLRLRRLEAERGEEIVAATLRSLERADRERRDAWRRSCDEGRRLSSQLAAGIAGGEAAVSRTGVEHEWARARAGEQRIAEEQRSLVEHREDLLAARRRLRVVERLRERALERHRLAEARAEQRALDDATACLRARRSHKRLTVRP